MPKIKIDGVEIEVPAGITILQACELAGRRDPALLLPRAPVDRRQLPHVPGRGEAGSAQAAGELRAARRRQAGDLHHHADGAEGAQGRDGVPADQPSARLPDLRPGRRVRPAGPGDGLRLRPQPLSREQARRARQGARPAGQDVDEPLHPLHALHPLRHRGGGRRGAGRDRPRREHGGHDLRRACADDRAFRQPGRSLPGRRADLEALCLRGAVVGARQDRSRST